MDIAGIWSLDIKQQQSLIHSLTKLLTEKMSTVVETNALEFLLHEIGNRKQQNIL
jgi:hypothetical protein